MRSKTFSISVFVVFFVLLIGATLYYSPSWGLMDDFQNLRVARTVAQSPDVFKAIGKQLVTFTAGFLRPSISSLDHVHVFSIPTSPNWILYFCPYS